MKYGTRCAARVRIARIRIATRRVRRRVRQSSIRMPTFSVTCQCTTWSPSMWPRVSVTWNQCRLCSVLPAFEIALRMASSLDFYDEPVNSIILYTWSLMVRSLGCRYGWPAQAVVPKRRRACPAS